MTQSEPLARRARRVAAGADAEVPSPCVSVCRIDPASGWCEGCLRTLDEIAGWSGLADGEKREVWRRIGQRAAGREGPAPAATERSAA